MNSIALEAPAARATKVPTGNVASATTGNVASQRVVRHPAALHGLQKAARDGRDTIADIQTLLDAIADRMEHIEGADDDANRVLRLVTMAQEKAAIVTAALDEYA